MRQYTQMVPGAQVTRKLAVSLIDASRVFEVFIAIILIGEHLPASFTLVTSAACSDVRYNMR